MDSQTLIVELTNERDRIDQAITALNGNTVRTTRRVHNVATPGTGKRRHLTAAAKQRIADAMKKRWAARKAAAATGKKPVLVGRKKAA